MAHTLNRPIWDLLACLGLVALTLLAFGGVCSNGFVNFDDDVYLQNNAALQTRDFPAFLAWAFQSYYADNWHPLTWLSLYHDYRLYGLHPWGYHLTNLLLHLANTLLLFGLLRRMTGAVGKSFVVAGLFAVHPLHVESVAWVTERKDVLSTLFFFLTLAAYLAFVLRPGKARYLLVLVLLSLGLMAKPMLVTLPCVLLLLDYWPLGRLRFGRKPAAPDGTNPAVKSTTTASVVLEKLPLFLPVLACCALTVRAQEHHGNILSLADLPLAQRLVNAAGSYGTYLRMTLAPFGLTIFYPYRAWTWEQAFPAGLVLVAATALALWQARARPYLLVGWLWFLGTLVPVLGLVQVGKHAVADRYTYIPLIGLFLLGTWLVAEVLSHARPAGALLAVALLGGCVFLSREQVRDWRDSVSLWRHALAINPDSPQAHLSLGLALSEPEVDEKEEGKGDRVTLWGHPVAGTPADSSGGEQRPADKKQREEEALAHFDQVSKFHQELAAALPAPDADGTGPRFNEVYLAYMGMADIYRLQGRSDLAIRNYQRTLYENGRYIRASYYLGLTYLDEGRLQEAYKAMADSFTFQSKGAEYWRYLGEILLRQGDLAFAEQQLKKALGISERYAPAHDVLGQVYAREGQLEEAATEFKRAGTLAPRDVGYHLDLALTLHDLGREEEARAEYAEAATLDPGWMAALNRTAWSLATNPQERLRDGTRAVRLARMVIQAGGPPRAEFYETLAAAHAEAGQFEAAVEQAQRALSLANPAGPPQLQTRLKEQVALYQGHQPYHARNEGQGAGEKR